MSFSQAHIFMNRIKTCVNTIVEFILHIMHMESWTPKHTKAFFYIKSLIMVMIMVEGS